MSDIRSIPTSLNLQTGGLGLVLPQLVDKEYKKFLTALLNEKLVELVIKGGKIAISFVKELAIWSKIGEFLSGFAKGARTSFSALQAATLVLNPPTQLATKMLGENESAFTRDYTAVAPLSEITSKTDLLQKFAIDQGEIVYKTLDASATQAVQQMEALLPTTAFADLPVEIQASINDLADAILQSGKSAEEIGHIIGTGSAGEVAATDIAKTTSSVTSLIEEIGIKGAVKIAALGVLKSIPVINLGVALATGNMFLVLNPVGTFVTLFFHRASMPSLASYFQTPDKQAVDVPGGLLKLTDDFKGKKVFGENMFDNVENRDIPPFNQQINMLVATAAVRTTALSLQALSQYSYLQQSLIFADGVINGSDLLSDATRAKFGAMIGHIATAANAVKNDLDALNHFTYVPIKEQGFDRVGKESATSTFYYNKLKDVSALIGKAYHDIVQFQRYLAMAAKLISDVNTLFIQETYNNLLTTTTIATVVANPTAPSNMVINPVQQIVSPVHSPAQVINTQINNQILQRVGTDIPTETSPKTEEKPPEDKEPAKRRRRRRKSNRNKRKKKNTPELITSIIADTSARSEWIQTVTFKFFHATDVNSNDYGTLTIHTKSGHTYRMGNFRRGTFSWIVTYGVGTGYGFWSQLPKKRAQLSPRTISFRIQRISKADRLAAIAEELRTQHIKYK